MNTFNNHRHQETEERIREALLYFMEREQQPTVSELCEYAQINRTTFYRHYTDVMDLMEKTERKTQKGLVQTLCGEETILTKEGFSFRSLEALIAYIGDNRHFYRVYLRNRAGIPMEESFRRVWDEQIVPLFYSYGVESESHMRYYFEYAKAGFMMVLQLWLENNCSVSPREITEILYKMFPSKQNT